MKRAMLVSLAVFGLAAVLSVSSVAQDPMKVASSIYKKLNLDNERVRVMEITFKPGESIPVHSHPDHILYVLRGSKVKITDAAGKVTELDTKAGDTLWVPAETHSAVNLGTGEFRALVIELKEPR